MPNILSNCFTSFPLGVSLPTVSAPSILFAWNEADIGPSLPNSVEYKCHPLSIFAENTISASSPPSIFSSDEK